MKQGVGGKRHGNNRYTKIAYNDELRFSLAIPSVDYDEFVFPTIKKKNVGTRQD